MGSGRGQRGGGEDHHPCLHLSKALGARQEPRGLGHRAPHHWMFLFQKITCSRMAPPMCYCVGTALMPGMRHPPPRASSPSGESPGASQLTMPSVPALDPGTARPSLLPSCQALAVPSPLSHGRPIAVKGVEKGTGYRAARRVNRALKAGQDWGAALEALQGPLLAQPWLHSLPEALQGCSSPFSLHARPADPAIGSGVRMASPSSLDSPSGHAGPGPAA